jgi:hypothetical protein
MITVHRFPFILCILAFTIRLANDIFVDFLSLLAHICLPSIPGFYQELYSMTYLDTPINGSLAKLLQQLSRMNFIAARTYRSNDWDSSINIGGTKCISIFRSLAQFLVS